MLLTFSYIQFYGNKTIDCNKIELCGSDVNPRCCLIGERYRCPDVAFVTQAYCIKGPGKFHLCNFQYINKIRLFSQDWMCWSVTEYHVSDFDYFGV